MLVTSAVSERTEFSVGTATPGACAPSATGTMYWTGWSSVPRVETDLAGNVLENYIFFNGVRIARRDASTKAVHLYFSDHLGTHSLITDQNGTMPPQYESDYFPYGGEIPITTGDVNHYKFTGKERDGESGLDYFGARYHSSDLGRFTKPDSKVISAQRLLEPQQLNLYAYVRNNPLRLVDSDGRELTLAPKMNAADTNSTVDLLATQFQKAGYRKIIMSAVSSPIRNTVGVKHGHETCQGLICGGTAGENEVHGPPKPNGATDASDPSKLKNIMAL